MPVEEAKERADTVLQWYVLVVTVLLVAGLLLPGNTIHQASGVLGALRLADLFPVFMGILLFQGTGERTGLMISVAALYLVQIALAYACISQAWLANDLVATCSHLQSHACTPAGGVEHLYIAVTNMFTVGNSYTPTTTAAEAVTALEPLSGVIFTGAVLTEILGHERLRGVTGVGGPRRVNPERSTGHEGSE
jgi:hypothetical protein